MPSNKAGVMGAAGAGGTVGTDYTLLAFGEVLQALI